MIAEAPTPRILADLIHPTERQRQFLRSVLDNDFVLYGGAAGGGKSYILRWGAIYLLMWWHKRLGINGMRLGLFCEDYPSLHDRHLSRLAFEVPPWLGRYRADTHELSLAPEYGQGVIAFRNLDDPSKYLSAEFAGIAVDELTRNEQQVFDFLRMRMRWPGLERPKFMSATNPGGLGHAWVKRLWLDRDFPPELTSIADQFVYIPAKASDNPHLPASYYENLKRLPPQMARAYAEGDWDLFEGQMFSEFRREIHVVKQFAIPQHWRRWMGHDPGVVDPATWLCLAADELGFVYVYREQTFSRDRTPEQAAPSEQAKAVQAAKRWRDDKDVEHVEEMDFHVVGHDAFAKDETTQKSTVDYYEEQGIGPIDQAAVRRGSRKERAMILHEYLRPFPHPTIPDQLTAKLRIFDNCKELLRTLPGLPIDEHEPDAVGDCTIDHWYDALTYALQAWHARRSELPPKVARPGSMAQVLKHDQVGKVPDRRASLLRRGV